VENRLEIVIDTNVFYAALRSSRGASHRLLQEIGINPRISLNLSVPVVLECEEVAKRNSRTLGLTHNDVDDILNYLCSVSRLHTIFYLWRPYLPDPDDDMLLELAVEATCNRLVTFNLKDFRGSEQFGVTPITPIEQLREIEALP
jgi:putative PIN family toxin of toxin-antitoxin system